MPFKSVSKPTFNFDVKIDLEFDIQGVEYQMQQLVREGIKFAFADIKDNFFVDIIYPLIYGGRGWYGIKDTPCWQWINSRKGIAQLGFSSNLEPKKLIEVYRRAWEVTPIENGMGLSFSFGDIQQIRHALIHPQAGKLNLPSDRSWFDWIYEGQYFRTEPAKFIQLGSGKGIRSSNAAGQYAGKMSNYKKANAKWSVPKRYRLNIDYLLDRNKEKLRASLENTISIAINDYLTGR